VLHVFVAAVIVFFLLLLFFNNQDLYWNAFFELHNHHQVKESIVRNLRFEKAADFYYLWDNLNLPILQRKAKKQVPEIQISQLDLVVFAPPLIVFSLQLVLE
jgi:hypothetical protein